MSRPATKQLTLRFVLRTLVRLRMVTRLNHEKLAKALLPHRTDVQFLGEYLVDVAEYMKKHRSEPLPHQRPCEECGTPNMRGHNGARYCSARCRHRAYRKRLIHRQGEKKRNERAICDSSFSADDKSNVTQSP